MGSPVTYVVRAAVPEDASAVASLLDELGYPAEPPAVATRMARLSSSSDGVLVVDSGGAPVAVATIHLIPLFHRDASVARITAFVVASHVRRRGVGSALIQACEAWGSARGAERAEVTSSDTRERAHSFYMRQGFEREGLRFTKWLSIPPPATG